ncbi:uncharacterized protein LOC130790118 [Actinidia eriantha]|uniref:uncharacterized protein LOC130790118 n=1 Tax=Actinidia eriantha TaxID=165200 RepID=UPI00258452A8|nr:uncharacterized protein LOC130790118 [Actinidia eriantha]
MVLVSSLRSHFVKHLFCTTTTTTTTFFLSIRGIHHRPRPHTSFSALASPFTGIRNQWDSNSITAKKFSATEVTKKEKFSTTAFSDIPANTSFTAPYLLVHIQCPRDVADMLSEALLCFGASSTSTDEQDNFETDDEVCITSIFSDCEDLGECISHAAKSIGLEDMPSYKVKKGDQSDWIKKTQESFYPVEITEGLWVVPEWRTPPDLQATNIILNPGLAFGTGEHPTTKLCLMLLHGSIKVGDFFLDYGTGSGILAIAAIKFGAALSVGLDVDPQAITSARQNASLNNLGAEKLQLHLVPSKKSCPTTNEAIYEGVEGQNSSGTGVIFEMEKYDVVIANILLNPLLDFADHIVSYAKPGAIVGVSGIISEQIPYIVERYSQYLEGISVSKMDDWACISGNMKINVIAS